MSVEVRYCCGESLALRLEVFMLCLTILEAQDEAHFSYEDIRPWLLPARSGGAGKPGRDRLAGASVLSRPVRISSFVIRHFLPAPANRGILPTVPASPDVIHGQAHDLRNQLTVVLGYCDVLSRADRPGAGQPRGGVLLDPIRAAGCVARIRGAARRCSEIATAMMRSQEDEADEQWPPVDLHPLLLDDVGLLSADLLRVGINVHVERGQDVPLVRIDALAVGRVVTNLAMNARDAILSDAGRRTTARILFATSRSAAGEAVLVVADDGPGMPAAVRARVFEPGYSTKPLLGQGRRGFGLAVVANCIQDAGGRVELESEPGRGTMFSIYLPAALKSTDVCTLSDRN